MPRQRSTHRPLVVDLSVDFDFFIREDPMWDFGHREGALFSVRAWDWRYAQIDLHRETDIRTHADFMPYRLRDKLAEKKLMLLTEPKMALGIADSHTHAAKFFRDNMSAAPDFIVNIDAHHDLWPVPPSGVDCASWATDLMAEMPSWTRFVQVYPKWKEPEQDGPPSPLGTGRYWPTTWAEWAGLGQTAVVRNVFICRSSAWVPPHHDGEFRALIEQFAAHRKGQVIGDVFTRTAPTAEEAQAQRDGQRANWAALEEAMRQQRTAKEGEARPLNELLEEGR